MGFKHKRKIFVSEHAMIRYLERVQDLDVNLLIEAVLGCEPEKLGRVLDGSYPIGDTHSIVVKNNTVVTVKKRENQWEKK